MAEAVGHAKPPDLDPNTNAAAASAANTTPTTTNAKMSYADRLKTNVKYDHRLKRNVLEITIEKDNKDMRVEMNEELTARILKSVGIDIAKELEGFQVTYGRIVTISAWMSADISLERFCQKEGIIVGQGLRTGSIRPAGKKDVTVTFAGVDFNTPDTLIKEYITKFGGKMVSQTVMYGRYKQGPFIGKVNNERKYQVDFSDSKMKMGTYHFLDGAKVRVFYRGNEQTCGLCHQGQASCPGGGISKECEKAGGQRRFLTDHMKELWTKIDFSPTTFELPENLEAEEKEDNMEGDMLVNKTNVVEKREIPRATKEKLTGLKINNFPSNITEEGVVKFLKENVKRDLDTVNFNLTDGRQNKNVVVFSGMNPDEIEAAMEKIDFKLTKQMFFDKPLYCRPLKNITPVKKDPPSRDENGQNDDAEEVKETGESETNIVKPKLTEEKKKKGRNGSNRPGGIDKFFTPDKCITKAYKSEFGEAIATGRIPLASPEQDGDSADLELKRKAQESPGVSPESKPLSKKDSRTSGIPKGNPKTGPK